MFASFPLLALPVLLYNLAIFTAPGGLHTLAASETMAQVLLTIPMASGARWTVTLGDLIIFISLVVLFIELLKSASNRQTAIINHSLSMILFIICLVEFLLLPGFGSSSFFLLTTMVVLDVLAGFIVTIVSSKRELDVRTD
jgi:hypothetical protein